jgi:hypothetical protein
LRNKNVAANRAQSAATMVEMRGVAACFACFSLGRSSLALSPKNNHTGLFSCVSRSVHFIVAGFTAVCSPTRFYCRTAPFQSHCSVKAPNFSSLSTLWKYPLGTRSHTLPSGSPPLISAFNKNDPLSGDHFCWHETTV